MRNKVCPLSLFAFILGLSMVLTGCSIIGGDKGSGPLPSPATNESLSGAENNLDKLTDKRMSRVAASVIVAESAVTKPEPSKADLAVAKSELKIARAMTGEPSQQDLAYAMSRSNKISTSADDLVEKILNENVARAEALKKEIDAANNKYEQEKAKKQAEFDAKLKEKEIEIRKRQMELEQERLAKEMERWTWVGIGMFSIGMLLTILAPLPILKKAGMALVLTGLICGSFPIVGNEPWFKYAVGGSIGLLLVGLLVKMFLFKPKCEVDNASKDTGSDSSGPSNGNN
jgi:hypothetical protein